MTVPVTKAAQILALRSYAKWSVERVSTRFKVSCQTVRNIERNPERAQLARRSRERNVKEIAKRRAMISRIASAKRYEVIRGRRVEAGRLYHSAASILAPRLTGFGLHITRAPKGGEQRTAEE